MQPEPDALLIAEAAVQPGPAPDQRSTAIGTNDPPSAHRSAAHLDVIALNTGDTSTPEKINSNRGSVLSHLQVQSGPAHSDSLSLRKAGVHRNRAIQETDTAEWKTLVRVEIDAKFA